MSHRVSPVIRPKHGGFAPGGNQQGSRADNTPTGTYIRGMSKGCERTRLASHAVSSSRQLINDTLLVLQCPSLHLSICVNARLDIILDILNLSCLVVYGNRMKS